MTDRVGQCAKSAHALFSKLAVYWIPIAVMCAPVLSFGQPAAAQDRTTVEVSLPGMSPGEPVDHAMMHRWLDWLAERDIAADRCGHDPRAGTIVLDLSSEQQLMQITDAGFTIVETLSPIGRVAALPTQPEYFDPDEIEAMLAQAAADHPDIVHLFSIGTTYEDRDIWAVEISDNPGIPEDEPAIQFNGQHHAREVATSHIVMDVIDTLTHGYGVDPTVTTWVNDYKTVCVPLVNPDGVWFVFGGDSMWRKNRAVYPPTCIGVDLNRNYPYRWGPDRCGSTTSCSGDLYKGPSSASELETQAMMNLADDYHFVMATSYHAYGRFIDYPYACSNGLPAGLMPEHDVIHEMMNGVADAIDAVDSVPRYTVYSPASAVPLSGDDTSWYYAHMGAYSFIIEVGTSFEPAFSLVSGIVSRNRAGWQYTYRRLGQARIDVHVANACTDQPLEAEVTLTDFAFDSGELPRMTFSPFGRWTFVVPSDASYTLRASKPGYTTRDLSVSVANSPVAVHVPLEPTSPCEPQIPTVSQWGLLITTLLLLTTGSGVIIRRQRA